MPVRTYRGTTQWREVDGLLLPAKLPTAIGLGCPACDDHVLVPFSRVELGGNHPDIAAFVSRHTKCRPPLHTLEVHDGQTTVTGELREKSS